MSRLQYSLKETEKEYLLFIPYALNDRAKAIEGRHWDRDRGCWIYPRTARIFDTLIADFADDLVVIEATRPTGRRTGDEESVLREENATLKQELETLRTHLESQSQNDEAGHLAQVLGARDHELSNAHRQLLLAQEQLVSLQARLQIAEGELEKRGHEKAPTNVEHDLREMAKAATGNDRDFCHFVDALPTPLGDEAVSEIYKRLERTLRGILHTPGGRLYELIQQAREMEIITEEARDLAHTIRRQRNTLAHQEVDRRTRRARVTLVLLAASLLWPLLPE